MKTLITGSGGFIGSHLKKWYENVDSEGCRGVDECDIRNGQFVHDAMNWHHSIHNANPYDLVIHLAAFTSAPKSIYDPSGYWQNNVGTLKTIIDHYDGPLFFASSAAVYKPLNPYALTKVVGEDMLEGRDLTTIGRFFNVYGPPASHSAPLENGSPASHSTPSRNGPPTLSNEGVIPTFIKNALRGEDLVVYGDAIRSFIYVEDLCEHIYFTAGNDYNTYDMGADPIKMSELASIIIGLTDSPSRIVMAERREGDPLYSAPRNLAACPTCNPKESIAKSGYVYKHSLHRGIEKTIEYYLKVI